MEIRNCRECGRLFNYLSGKPICPECKAKLEDKFAQVKEYIRENGLATMQQVAEDNDVSMKQIKAWIREERLCFSEDSPITIECESCGAPIRTGKYCAACASKISNNLSQGINKPVKQEVKKDPRERERMRFLDQQ